MARVTLSAIVHRPLRRSVVRLPSEYTPTARGRNPGTPEHPSPTQGDPAPEAIVPNCPGERTERDDEVLLDLPWCGPGVIKVQENVTGNELLLDPSVYRDPSLSCDL